MSRGFTLVELVVVIGIFAVMAVVISSLFLGQYRIYRTQTAELNINAGTRSALDDIDAFVKQASKTLASYSTYTAGPSVLILQVQSVNAANQLVVGAFDTVVYYLTSTTLNRQIFVSAQSVRAASTKKLAENVTGLNFTYNHSDYAQVSQVSTAISISESAGVQNRSLTASNTTRIRNAHVPQLQNVTWINAIGVNVSTNNLTKSAAGGQWGNAGASSTQAIQSGDGYIEFSTAEANKHKIGGLNNTDSNQTLNEIQFGLYVQSGGSQFSGGTFVVEESGATIFPVFPAQALYNAGDTFKVSVESGVVKYYHNNILFYTSLVAPAYPLIFDTAFYETGATITNAKISY